MSRTAKFNREEIALAKRLFFSDQAKDSVKSPRPIAVVTTIGARRTRTLFQSEVTYRDYLRDARRMLKRGDRGN
jgi:hypothetical protein